MRWTKIRFQPDPVCNPLNDASWHSAEPVVLEHMHQLVHHDAADLVADALGVSSDLSEVVGGEVNLCVVGDELGALPSRSPSKTDLLVCLIEIRPASMSYAAKGA